LKPKEILNSCLAIEGDDLAQMAFFSLLKVAHQKIGKPTTTRSSVFSKQPVWRMNPSGFHCRKKPVSRRSRVQKLQSMHVVLLITLAVSYLVLCGSRFTTDSPHPPAPFPNSRRRGVSGLKSRSQAWERDLGWKPTVSKFTPNGT